MMLKFSIYLMFLFFVLQSSCAQKRGDVRVMFYNAENLFDTIDHRETIDEEFTPNGRLRWNGYRYYTKLQHLYKVIAGVGGWRPPDIIGLSEVENREVLNDLLKMTPLRKYQYQIVHFESPDPRGIDVALLFRTGRIKLINSKPVPVNFAEQYHHHTRDILSATLLIGGSDTLHVFINHWPSRRGGAAASEFQRMTAARRLRHAVDSVLSENPGAACLLMGDFNDEPRDHSIVWGLKAYPPAGELKTRFLYNLIPNTKKSSTTGTIYFRGQWQLFDQVIVSGNLLRETAKIHTTESNVHIYAPAYILQYDQKNLVFRTFPTYLGPRYLGGFSDHLPVYIDLFIKN